MEMDVTEIEPGVIAVTLTGRLDIEGAHAIDLRYSAVAGNSRGLMVDLSRMTFLASIGIRTLYMGARTVTRRGGRFALLQPNQQVQQVLAISGMIDLMPIYQDRAEALAAVVPAA